MKIEIHNELIGFTVGYWFFYFIMRNLKYYNFDMFFILFILLVFLYMIIRKMIEPDWFTRGTDKNG